MLIKMGISGLQTGSDRGGIEACMKLGIPYGGFVPKDYRAEDGKIPEKYYNEKVIETKYYGYEKRTVLNVQQSDGTIIFGQLPLSTGSSLTVRACNINKKPFFVVPFPFVNKPYQITLIRDFIKKNNIEYLNIAGNRESISPGIQESVKELMIEVLK